MRLAPAIFVSSLVVSGCASAPPAPPVAPFPADTKAMKAYEEAIDDFLNTDFDEAARKLEDTIRICAGGCSATVLGRVHVALGSLDALAKANLAAAQDEFVAALKADPAAQLIPWASDLDVERAFQAAQQIVQGAPAAAPAHGAGR